MTWHHSRGITMDERHQALAAAVTRFVTVPVDELDEPTLVAELRAAERQRRRLDARECELAGAMTARQQARARQARPDDPRAGERAGRQVARQLADELRLPPGEAKRLTEIGGMLRRDPDTAAATRAGRLSPAHARVVGKALRRVLDPTVKDLIRAALLAAAATRDAAALQREADRLLGVHAPEVLEAEARDRHAARRAAATMGDDGMLHVNAQVAGIGAETVQTAIHAFRRPDRPGEHRRPEQATADALVAVCQAALDAGTAPAERKVRPHVTITFTAEQLAAAQGSGEGMWSGPLSILHAAGVLDDCDLTATMLDDDGNPLGVTSTSRYTPRRLKVWLEQRDRGCIAQGCDRPARWCQVMHLHRPFRDGGPLHPSNAALGCHQHHRAFDHGQLQLTWTDGRPVLHPPDRTPCEERQPALAGQGPAP